MCNLYLRGYFLCESNKFCSTLITILKWSSHVIYKLCGFVLLMVIYYFCIYIYFINIHSLRFRLYQIEKSNYYTPTFIYSSNSTCNVIFFNYNTIFINFIN